MMSNETKIEWCGIEYELKPCNGGLWPHGVGEAALLCNPQFDYDDSYGTRIDSSFFNTKEWIVGWVVDGVFFGAVVELEVCEPFATGIVSMACNQRVKRVTRLERKVI